MLPISLHLQYSLNLLQCLKMKKKFKMMIILFKDKVNLNTTQYNLKKVIKEANNFKRTLKENAKEKTLKNYKIK